MPWPRKKRTTNPVVQCKKRFFDAQWRSSITFYYEILRRILPPSDRLHKRKRGRARVLKAAMQHLKYMESTIVELLGGRALRNMDYLRNYFEHFVEQHPCGVGVEMAKNAVALLLDENGVPRTDELIPMFRHERPKQSHTKIKPLKGTKRTRVLLDITSSTINTSVAPSACMQEGNYNTDAALHSNIEGRDYSLLMDENYFLEEFISLNIERVQVVPQNDYEWVPLMSSLQCDHIHDDQLVPGSPSNASNILLYIKQGEANKETACAASDLDPVLGSAQLGPNSPEKPLSAFGDISWSSIEWMLDSDPQRTSSSQEVPEQ